MTTVEFWNQRYQNADGQLFGSDANLFLQEEAAKLPANQRILCVADGDGRNSIFLAKQGHQVDAFDVAEVGVAKARECAAQQGVAVNYSVAGMDDWAWPQDTYDVVAGIFIQFADPETRARKWQLIARALRPGGLLVLQGYGPRQIEYNTGGPRQAANLYTMDLLREELGSLFEIELLTEADVELFEGKFHHGMSHLVSCFARRR